jgi:hypothetical protein
MKWFLNPCRRHRANLCLLASGALAEPEMNEVRAHLAECADCRKYHDEIISLAKPLAAWEANFAHVIPTRDAQTRWTKEIQEAANTKSIRRPEPLNVFFNCWLELVWPCRRIWTGLAAIWILIFIFNFSQRDPSELMARKTPPPSPEMILAFRQQQQLLAELIGQNETRATPPPKPFAPQPRSEGRIEMLKT